MSNYRFWERPGARDIFILGSHVGPHVANIGDIYIYVYTYMVVYDGKWMCMKVYGGIWKYTKVYADICRHMGIYSDISVFPILHNHEFPILDNHESHVVG